MQDASPPAQSSSSLGWETSRERGSTPVPLWSHSPSSSQEKGGSDVPHAAQPPSPACLQCGCLQSECMQKAESGATSVVSLEHFPPVSSSRSCSIDRASGTAARGWGSIVSRSPCSPRPIPALPPLTPRAGDDLRGLSSGALRGTGKALSLSQPIKLKPAAGTDGERAPRSMKGQ